MSENSTSARDIAVWALADRSGNVSASLDRLLGRSGLGREDRALASELALGACRRLATLDAVARAYLADPDRRLPGALNQIIQVALYQLLFLTRVPDFAAVNEAVEQAISHRHRRQSGLVNGLLRTVIRNISQLCVGPPPLAADIVPVGPKAYRAFTKAVFPDPKGDPTGYLAQAYSLPAVLAGRWIKRFGSPQAAAAIATHANCRPPLILRVNALRTTVDGAIAAIATDGITANRHTNGVSVVLDGHTDIRRLAAFDTGLFQPQDSTATAIVAEAVRPRAGENVLDFCAAPGTKTTHMAELMGNSGSITAVDVSATKLGAVESNCHRLGITIVQTVPAERVGSLQAGGFDAVLADVPCSNTGVLARRVEARWRFDEETVAKLVADQLNLLAAAGVFVKPGGRLIYSTCSIEPEECADLAAEFARRFSRFKLIADKLTLPAGADDPTHWSDGGYYGVFQA